MPDVYDDTISMETEKKMMQNQQPARLFLDSSSRNNLYAEKTQTDYALSAALNTQLATFGVSTNEVYKMVLDDSTSDAVFDLDSGIYRPTGARLIRAVIPNTFSTFTPLTNQFNVINNRANIQYTIRLPIDRRYVTYTQLKNELNALIQAEALLIPVSADLAGITLDIDENIGRLVVQNGTPNNIAIYPPNINLGFQHPHVIAAGAQDTALGVVLLNPYRSLFLRCEFTNIRTASTNNAGDLLAEIPVPANIGFGDNIVFEPQSGDPIPIDENLLTRIRLTLTDFSGNRVNLKSRNWSSEIEFSYDQ
jgi:hypothetical protein